MAALQIAEESANGRQRPRNRSIRQCIEALPAVRQVSAQIARFELGEISGLCFAAQMVGEEPQKRRDIALVSLDRIGREPPLIAQMRDPLGKEGGSDHGPKNTEHL